MVDLVEMSPENVTGESSAANQPRRSSRSSARLAAAKISSNFETMKRASSESPVKKAKKKAKLVKEEPVAEEVTDESTVTAEEGDISDSNTGTVALVAAPAVEPGNFHAAATETLRVFNKHYLHFIHEEEKRYAQEKAKMKPRSSPKGKGKKVEDSKKSPSKENATNDKEKNPSKRPDLKAITEMMTEKSVLFHEKRIGHIPGIDVGHQFFSRAEMVVVGLHHHWLNGIDYIGKTKVRATKYLDPSYQLPLTVSIVLSGQYEDDLDNCDEIVYTGQGGNDLLGNKKQVANQVLKRGNLGLKHCMEHSVPVRVTRGRKCRNSYVGKVYTYDGLYQVIKYWAEPGVSGFTVYKFRLKRMEGQPPLLTDEQVQFSRGNVPTVISDIRGLVNEDITGGLEDIPIPATNLVDKSPMLPEGFTYIKEMKYAKNVDVPKNASNGCNCRGEGCFDPKTCACARFNGGDFPYVQKDGGRLVEPKGVVFECGPHCGCGPKCVNKTSQKPKYRLEIFRTPKKGWGVRSWDFIPSGAPVCEYIGLLKKTEDLDPAADNSYVFDIDCLQTMKGLDGRESRLRDVSLPSHLKVSEDVSETVPFCIDAGQTGNLTRFINHSCQPNLFVQCMLSKHHDMSQARVILVAADNIPPLKELTYDYGYALDSVVGPDGEIRRLPCFCGAEGCRKRLY